MTYEIWLGCRASIWSHRGYTVRGETVYTSSMRDALRVARASLAHRIAWVECNGARYGYESRATARDDDTGARALVVISRTDSREPFPHD